MTNLLVRDLPDDVYAALTQRARRDGQSLQQYLTRLLTRLAQQPTLDEMLERIAQRDGGTVGFSEAVNDLSSERSRD